MFVSSDICFDVSRNVGQSLCRISKQQWPPEGAKALFILNKTLNTHILSSYLTWTSHVTNLVSTIDANRQSFIFILSSSQSNSVASVPLIDHP